MKIEKCKRHGIEFENPDDLVEELQIKLLKDDPDFMEKDRELMTLLKTHTLGPLVEQYERTIAQLNKDLSQTKFDFK